MDIPSGYVSKAWEEASKAWEEASKAWEEASKARVGLDFRLDLSALKRLL
jgi:hypothetical protein